jgi:hypothetical protein
MASLIRRPPNHRRRRRNPRLGASKRLAQKCTAIAVTTRGQPRSWSWKAMLYLDRYAGLDLYFISTFISTFLKSLCVFSIFMSF